MATAEVEADMEEDTGVDTDEAAGVDMVVDEVDPMAVEAVEVVEVTHGTNANISILIMHGFLNFEYDSNG